MNGERGLSSGGDQDILDYAGPFYQEVPAAPANDAPVQAEPPPPVLDPLPGGIRVERFTTAARSPLLLSHSDSGRNSAVAGEQYRIARTRVRRHPLRPRMIAVSSPGSGDGKSVTAINLASILSVQNEGPVLVVDTDFRRCTIHKQLGLAQTPGLWDVLRAASKLEQALVRAEQLPNLYVLPAGKPTGNPSELLDSTAWTDLLAGLRRTFHYALMDAPPVQAVADYELIEAACDGVIVVVRPDHTNRLLLRQALQNVHNDKLIGLLLNCVPRWFLDGYAPAHFYYSREQKTYLRADKHENDGNSH